MSGNSRHKARLVAFQTLYAVDVGAETPEASLQTAIEASSLSEESAAFARRLVLGVAENRSGIDDIIAARARGYTLDRLAAVDRAILRLALFELIHEKDTPEAVAINEAVELAKKYSNAESGAFVNGILGQFVRERSGSAS